MKFLELPKEIRLMVYSEILVRSEPIKFDGFSYPLRFQHGQGDGLWLELLLVNKQVHSEAKRILYSNNIFAFGPNPPPSQDYEHTFGLVHGTIRALRADTRTQIFGHSNWGDCAQLLGQIGTEAVAFIQHMAIQLPGFEYCELNAIKLPESYDKDFQLIRDKCTNIATLELYLEAWHVLRYDPNYTIMNKGFGPADTFVRALALLNKRFQAIPSLKNIIMNFDNPYKKHETSSNIDDKLIDRMKAYGWTIKSTQLPEPIHRSVDGTEFGDLEERLAYDKEQLLSEYNHRKQQERERMIEENKARLDGIRLMEAH